MSQWNHLYEATHQMSPYLPDVSVGLLIGSNCAQAHQPLKVIPSTGNGPFAALYPHGWTIIGPLNTNHDTVHAFFNRINVQEISFRENILHLLGQDFLDAYSPPGKLGLSQEDIIFLKQAEANVKLIDGHYVLPLPFRDVNKNMPNNREQVVKRANWQKKKMLADGKYYTDYVGFMTELLINGYAEKVDTLTTESDQVWYLPHHAVSHPMKPNKIRVVFDCSARYKNTSLNDRLIQGPDLTNSLIGVLIRFRQEQVAFIGDIKAMFHQVQVEAKYHNYLRFLWWPDGDLEKPLQEYRMVVHLFGAASSPSIANFALKKTADQAESLYGCSVANTIRRNFYVDDCLKAVGSEDEAVRLIHDLCAACKLGGFHLTKFCSNSTKVLDSIPKEHRSEEIKLHTLDYDVLPSERALGVYWHVHDDTFGFSIQIKDKPVTRRGILSVTSSVFDPLGFVPPFILGAKKILQDLCREDNIDWDDPVPDSYIQRWSDWLQQLPLLEQVHIDRCIKPPDFGTITVKQLHVFSDASTIGYGCSSYLRIINDKGYIHCSFLMGKVRLAPMKTCTIPRLELTAATVAVRIGCILQQELDICLDDIFYHTDSTTVLHYILNQKKRFPVFVANRVQFIQDHSENKQWRYVGTRENPADYASRGMNAYQLANETHWLRGPDFLWTALESSWPKQPVLSNDYTIDDKATILSTVTGTEHSVSTVQQLVTYYSDWFCLKKSVAIYRKFFKMLHLCSLNSPSNKTVSDVPISVTDINEAEYAILKFTQSQHFHHEIDILIGTNSEHPAIPKSSSIYKLDPFILGDLLRVGGRLTRAHIPDNSKFPVLLPNKSHVTTLIIRNIHVKLAHAGRNHVLAHLRESYWVIHANSAVRRVLSKCVTCRRLRAPVLQQKMSDLPVERTSTEPPFTYTGSDLFGPFLIKQGRKERKYYGVIFTCLASRAVHLEVAASLDTDSFIHALRRFIARRGPITQIRCDNGTNLVGSERELHKALIEMNDDKITQMLRKQSITWIFNPPCASHMGGIWERQIRTVRKVLASLSLDFGDKLDLESFQTLMCEIEAIINSRPLTTISSDPQDDNPLTPNHILTMKSSVVLPPPGNFQHADIYSRKRWRRVQHIANVFWTRWKKEYLLTLQERQKWSKSRRNLQIGDDVLMKDEFTTRNLWPLARIRKTEPDSKGYVRSVILKTSSSEYRRPVDRVVLLLPMEEQ